MDTPKSLKTLRRCTTIAWVTWLLSLALLWGQHQLSVLHPYSHVFLGLLLLTTLSAVVGLVGGLWRVLLGPRRAFALGWTFTCVAPVLLWALMAASALHAMQQGTAPPNFVRRTVTMAAASLMELQARYLYPYRLETQRLVMFYDADVSTPELDAKTMEEHVARLEELTGKKLREKIFWIRGRSLGREKLALYGLALGTPESPDWNSPDGKGFVDRHELAHAVLHQHYGPGTDPPSFLVEGWAEAQAGFGSEKQAQWALTSREWTLRKRWPDKDHWLRELAGEEGHYRHDGPIYSVGGAFADFLLRKFGVERFLNLYFICQPGTFEDDCRNILGIDLDSLENEFWKEAERLGGNK